MSLVNIDLGAIGVTTKGLMETKMKEEQKIIGILRKKGIINIYDPLYIFRSKIKDYKFEVSKKALELEFKRQKQIVEQRKESKTILIKKDRKQLLMERYRTSANFSGNYICREKGDCRKIIDYSPENSAALITVNEWIQYSRRYGTYVHMTGLVIRDPELKQLSFIRVPPETKTVQEALNYIIPAKVKKAIEKGLEVKRQGDFYFIPSKKFNLKALEWTNHKAKECEDGCIIKHYQHQDLHLKTPHIAIRQRQVRNGKPRHLGGYGFIGD